MLSQLRPEFPDVTISKIRFLESEGLVRPARTSSGYRQFTAADVERLRFVLAAQRDRYLPLKVIKEQLDAAEQQEDVPRASRPLVAVDDEPARHFAAAEFEPDSVPRLTAEELLSRSGIDRAMLVDLEQYGLIRPGPAGFYDPDAVVVASTVRAMTEYGIEPRHLRAFRASADREVGLLEQIVTPMYRQRGSDARGRADEAVRELAALSVTLHTLLVKAGLKNVAGG